MMADSKIIHEEIVRCTPNHSFPMNSTEFSGR